MKKSSRRTLVELLDAARQGEDQALSELLDRLRPEVERYLRGRLDSSPSTAALADELTQVVLLKAAASIDDCRAGTPAELRAWVRTIARRSAIDWHRRRKLEIDRRVWEDLEEVPGELLGQAMVEKWISANVKSPTKADRALGRLLTEAQAVLSEGTRVVIRRRLLYRDTWAEAGRAIGTTPAGAKRRWQRARERLRREVLNRVEELCPSLRRKVRRRLGE